VGAVAGDDTRRGGNSGGYADGDDGSDGGEREVGQRDRDRTDAPERGRELRALRQGAGDPRFLQAAEGEPAAWSDDGTGVEIDGKRWFFAAFYAFSLWQKVPDVTQKMAVLYTLTEDAAYAHKAGVLLGRMADLYPGRWTTRRTSPWEWRRHPAGPAGGRSRG